MKAVVLKDKMKKGDKIAPLYYEEIETPQPKKGEVLVRLHYAAVNRRDVFIRYGAYPGIEVPSVLGSDGAGVIVALGEGVSNIAVGSEVVINPALDWGDNIDYPQAEHTVLGVPSNGTYAQYVTVPAENVLQKPSHLTLEEAAAIPLGALTAYRAVVTKGEVKPSDTVIIPGVGGGVATFALQIAVAKGATVFVTSSSDEKIAYAKELGATGGVNYRNKDWVKQLKALSGGANLSIDSIGGSTFNDLIYLAKPGSKIVSFGATLGPVEQVVMPRIFFKQLHILGTTMGSASEFKSMIDFYEAHKLKPVIDGVYDIQDIENVHEKMDKGKVFGKMVLKIPHD
ncbi:zinc-binding dehydrogenase [Cytobacillus sp. Sa5YUA1]|uniref:Zinc-binding dehydrogenase n=1 Tax=Cytobacillus stercorigallinarum TaxID=2762240 RepID=A0ABR8QLY0_9BACI|nr:zinc-binding dehydrogenase [Cytobacillus stercorigallinarum]MBD7936538.1 zinc-binding dehydrogenase [Cytobacillus stercorigallinarum]